MCSVFLHQGFLQPPPIPLLEQGELMASERQPKDPSDLKEWKNYNSKMMQAIREHRNIWRYGDIRDDE